MTLHRRAPTAFEQPEPLIESPSELGGGQRRRARRGEFDCERDPVETPTNLSDPAGIGGVQHEIRLDGPGAVDEQSHRLALGD